MKDFGIFASQQRAIGLVSLVIAGMITSCSKSQLTLETELRTVREQSNQAIAAHDTAGIAKTLTADYHVLTSRNAESDKAKMLVSLAADMQAKPDLIYKRDPQAVRIFSQWGMASEYGQWTGFWTEPAGGEVVIKGTYYAKWQLIDERWLIRAEIFTALACNGEPYCTQMLNNH